MRLIDADAIPWTDLNDNPNSKIRVLITFADKVNRMPTIELRKTGKWIPVTNGRGGHECDQCHNYAPAWQTGEERLTDYCPNCGAEMKGDDG